MSIVFKSAQMYMEKMKKQGDDVPKAHSFACVLLRLPESLAELCRSYREKIDVNDLDETPGEPYPSPHVTVLYGISDESIEKVRKLVEKIEPFVIEFEDISLFENEKDVLKIDVVSQDLIDLHSKIKKAVPNEHKYDYSPHVTIAYLKSGSGGNYVGTSPLDGKVALVSEIIVVDTQDSKHVIHLGNKN